MLSTSDDVLIQIMLCLEPIDVLYINLVCWRLNNVRPNYRLLDPHQIGDVFRLDKTYCDYSKLILHNHLRLVVQTPYPTTCLVKASKYGKPEIMDGLIRVGAIYNETCLIRSLEAGNDLDVILKIYPYSDNQVEILSAAARGGNIDTFKYILSKLDAEYIINKSTIMLAGCKGGSIEIVKIIDEYSKHDMKLEHASGMLMTFYVGTAVRYSNIDLAEYLLRLSNFRPQICRTAISSASNEQDMLRVTSLLRSVNIELYDARMWFLLKDSMKAINVVLGLSNANLLKYIDDLHADTSKCIELVALVSKFKSAPIIKSLITKVLSKAYRYGNADLISIYSDLMPYHSSYFDQAALGGHIDLMQSLLPNVKQGHLPKHIDKYPIRSIEFILDQGILEADIILDELIRTPALSLHRRYHLLVNVRMLLERCVDPKLYMSIALDNRLHDVVLIIDGLTSS